MIQVLRPAWPALRLMGWPWVEPVDLCARRHGYLPHRFRWRGMLHRVGRVERSWERPGWLWRSPRRYFLIRCHDERRLRLFQDLQRGTWFVEVA